MVMQFLICYSSVFKIEKTDLVISSEKMESTAMWAYLCQKRNPLCENRGILCACTNFLFCTTNGNVWEVNGLVWRFPQTKTSVAEY